MLDRKDLRGLSVQRGHKDLLELTELKGSLDRRGLPALRDRLDQSDRKDQLVLTGLRELLVHRD